MGVVLNGSYIQIFMLSLSMLFCETGLNTTLRRYDWEEHNSLILIGIRRLVPNLINEKLKWGYIPFLW